MMMKTLCLFFVLALIAQVCAIPVPDENDEADELEGQEAAIAAQKKAEQAKKHLRSKSHTDDADVEAEAKAAARKAAAKLKHKKEAEAIPIEDSDDADAAAEAHKAAGAHHPGKHAKDCHKPGAGKPKGDFLDIPKRALEKGEQLIKEGINIEKELFSRLFG